MSWGNPQTHHCQCLGQVAKMGSNFFSRNWACPQWRFGQTWWPKMLGKHGGFLMFSVAPSLIHIQPMELVNGLIQPGEHQLGCQNERRQENTTCRPFKATFLVHGLRSQKSLEIINVINKQPRNGRFDPCFGGFGIRVSGDTHGPEEMRVRHKKEIDSTKIR